MKCAQRVSTGSLFRRSFIVVAAVLIPQAVCAGSIDLVRTTELGNLNSIVAKKIAKKSMGIGLDDNGDVTLTYNRMSLTVTYNPDDLMPQPRERVALAQPESPAVSGIGIKLGVSF
ncbi:MAG: hypothetical protein GJT30_15845 [Geobacter sp.]|nr:hypothetical protein [Geobacter sp.]